MHGPVRVFVGLGDPVKMSYGDDRLLLEPEMI